MNFDVISPKNREELLQAMSANQGNNFRFGAGYTDIALELKDKDSSDLLVVNLGLMEDEIFKSINKTNDGVRLGAMATAEMLIDNSDIGAQFPVLVEAAESVASRQIRHTATIGGNICTASPSGDMSCALVALKASCEILNVDGETRSIPIDDFFTGVKQNALAKDEVLLSVFIPSNKSSNIQSGFIKIGKRLSMEISILSLSYHFQKNEAGEIVNAGIAIGAVAPTIKFTESACEYLIGKTGLSLEEREKFAEKVQSYASPISDIRASAWYRSEVLFNISKGIFEL